MDVSLSDEYVLLLQNVVDENKALREKIEQQSSETKSSLNEIKAKMNEMGSRTPARSSRPARQCRGPTRVPKICRVRILSVSCFHAFNCPASRILVRIMRPKV